MIDWTTFRYILTNCYHKNRTTIIKHIHAISPTGNLSLEGSSPPTRTRNQCPACNHEYEDNHNVILCQYASLAGAWNHVLSPNHVDLRPLSAPWWLDSTGHPTCMTSKAIPSSPITYSHWPTLQHIVQAHLGYPTAVVITVATQQPSYTFIRPHPYTFRRPHPSPMSSRYTHTMFMILFVVDRLILIPVPNQTTILQCEKWDMPSRSHKERASLRKLGHASTPSRKSHREGSLH